MPCIQKNSTTDVPEPLRLAHGVTAKNSGIPSACSLFNHLELAIGHDGSIYTAGIGRCYLPGLLFYPREPLCFILYQHTMGPEITHRQRKSKSKSGRMERTRGKQEALGPCPGLLRVPFICCTNTVLYWSQPTRLLRFRTQMSSNRPEVATPPLPPLRSTAKVGQSLLEGMRVIKKESSRLLVSVRVHLSRVQDGAGGTWASVPHGQPQGLGPCCPQPQLWACSLGLLIPGPRAASVHPHRLQVSC